MPSLLEHLERAGRRARYCSKDVAFLRVLERYAAHRSEPLAAELYDEHGGFADPHLPGSTLPSLPCR